MMWLPQEPAPAMMQALPELPPNARYEFHRNECGLIVHALNLLQITDCTVMLPFT